MDHITREQFQMHIYLMTFQQIDQTIEENADKRTSLSSTFHTNSKRIV